MSTKIKLKTNVMARSRRALAFMTSQHSPEPVNAKYNQPKKQQGFTLIELLVVVSILAALAGLASVAMNGYQQESEETITRVEMQRISNAIRRFKVDTGYWPKTETKNGTKLGVNDSIIDYAATDAANFNFLFSKPDVDMPDWNPEYAIGWHGPYIDLPAIKAVTIDTLNPDLGCSGSGSTHEAAVHNLTQMKGLVDRFQQIRKKNSGEKYCVLANFNIGDTDGDGKDNWQFKVAKYSASPYLYEAKFTHENSALCTKDIADSTNSETCVALRSFGPNGIDNGGNDDSDDIVFVLEVNSELGE